MKEPILAELATYPEKALLDEATLATMFAVSARTITRWSQHGELPPPARIGGRKFWLAGRILAFIEQRITDAEMSDRRSDAKKRAETP